MTETYTYRREPTPEEEAKALELLANPIFKRLNRRERAKIFTLMRNPGAQELDIFLRVWGHTPSQVVHIMAREFAERFSPGYSPEYLQFVTQSLTPSHDWITLDIKICAFAQDLFHVTDMDGALDFWDRMRYLLYALPRRRDYKRYEPLEELGTKQDHKRPECEWQYEVCELCWRTAPLINFRAKKTVRARCFLHSLEYVSPDDPTYRKYNRLQEIVNAGVSEIEDRLREIYPKQVSSAMNRETHRKLNIIHLTSPTSPLKNLVAYIKQQLRQYDLATKPWDIACRLLLETFHGPFDDRVDSPYREAMAAYIHDRVYYEPLIDIPQLALAEAWLGVLKRDRRRKGE